MSITNVHSDEVSLLDLLVVIAESWVILLIVPAIAAMLAFASFTLLDDLGHEAQAVIRLSKEDAALVTSARVLDAALARSEWLERYSGDVSLARERLAANLSASPIKDTGTYIIALKASSPDIATGTLQAVIASLVESSAPSADSRASLELRLSNLERSREVLQASLLRIDSLIDADAAEAMQIGEMEIVGMGASVASLASQVAATEEAISSTMMALDGSISASDVIHAPTVVTSPTGLRSAALQSLLVGAGVGFILLVAIFTRAGLRAAADDPVTVSKLNRIRRAFWLRPKLTEPQS